MKQPESALLDLAARIEKLRDILASNGHTSWAERLDADAGQLRAGSRLGCQAFLSHFGGMGSLNDIAVGDAETDALFQQLAGQAQDIAKTHYPTFLQQLSAPLRVIVVGGAGCAAAVLLWSLTR